jgi:hypothetical protein
MNPKTVATIIFATVYLIAFAVMSPVLLISRVDARHHTERTHDDRMATVPSRIP